MSGFVTKLTTAFGDVEPYYQLFSLETVSQAPKVSGLYAWYAGLNAGLKDWELEIVDGIDIGTDRLRSLLKRHTDRYCFSELETTALGAFSQTWTGQLQDQTANSLRSVLAAPTNIQEQDSYDQKRAPKLQSTLESRDKRRLMVKALEMALPVLSAPIYVGVADCLHTRLSQHVREIYQLTNTVLNDPASRERLRKEKKTNFALRAIAAGFSPENLQVWTFNLDLLMEELENKTQDARTVAEAVEWVLNRWHRPYLGRR
jgi:hypothetical protein